MDIRKFFSPPKSKPTAVESSAKAKSAVKIQKIQKSKTPVKKSKTPVKKEPKQKKKDIEEVIIDSDEDFSARKSPSKEQKKKTGTAKNGTGHSRASSSRKEKEVKKKRALSIDSESEEETTKKSRRRSTDENKNEKKGKHKHEKNRRVVQSSSEEEVVIEDPDDIPKSKTKKGRTKKGHVIIDSDSEDEESPLPKAKSRSRGQRAQHAFSDSDDEQKQDIRDVFKKMSPAKKPAAKPPEPSSPPAKGRVMSAADFFGTTPVHNKPTPVKRKASEEKLPNGDPDLEFHDDEDFEKTLLQLDESNPAKRARTETSPKKEEKTKVSESSSLSSKLSKMKSVTEEKEETSSRKSHTTPHKKKSSPGADTPSEKKSGPGYRSYLSREGPRALGSKEIPEGGENCLEGLVFVITGVLESIERDEAKTLVERYGGKVTGSISKKTNYLVVGRDAGTSKTAKAAQLGTKQIDEDGLFDLLRTLPAKKKKVPTATLR